MKWLSEEDEIRFGGEINPKSKKVHLYVEPCERLFPRWRWEEGISHRLNTAGAPDHMRYIKGRCPLAHMEIWVGKENKVYVEIWSKALNLSSYMTLHQEHEEERVDEFLVRIKQKIREKALLLLDDYITQIDGTSQMIKELE